MKEDLIIIFPLSAEAFGLWDGWILNYASQMVNTAYLLVILALILYVGIMILKRIETFELDKKSWNIPFILIAISVWPHVVIGLKNLMDTFNTYLVREVFRIEWKGFGFVEAEFGLDFLWWSLDSLSRLLPNFAYWVLYCFFIVYIFFFAALGPLVLAKGVFNDEVETFLELILEIFIIFLWQTTLVVLICFILPEIVQGEVLGKDSGPNVYFRSLLLGLIMFFIPSISRKFGNHLGNSMFTPGLVRLGTTMGIMGLGYAGSRALAAAHVSHPMSFNKWTHRALFADDLIHRYRRSHELEDLKDVNYNLESNLEKEKRHHNLGVWRKDMYAQENQSKRPRHHDRLVELSKDAKEALENRNER